MCELKHVGNRDVRLISGLRSKVTRETTGAWLNPVVVDVGDAAAAVRRLRVVACGDGGAYCLLAFCADHNEGRAPLSDRGPEAHASTSHSEPSHPHRQPTPVARHRLPSPSPARSPALPLSPLPFGSQPYAPSGGIIQDVNDLRSRPPPRERETRMMGDPPSASNPGTSRSRRLRQRDSSARSGSRPRPYDASASSTQELVSSSLQERRGASQQPSGSHSQIGRTLTVDDLNAAAFSTAKECARLVRMRDPEIGEEACYRRVMRMIWLGNPRLFDHMRAVSSAKKTSGATGQTPHAAPHGGIAGPSRAPQGVVATPFQPPMVMPPDHHGAARDLYGQQVPPVDHFGMPGPPPGPSGHGAGTTYSYGDVGGDPPDPAPPGSHWYFRSGEWRICSGSTEPVGKFGSLQLQHCPKCGWTG